MEKLTMFKKLWNKLFGWTYISIAYVGKVTVHRVMTDNEKDYVTLYSDSIYYLDHECNKLYYKRPIIEIGEILYIDTYITDFVYTIGEKT